MPVKTFNDAGDEIEAFTAEELEAQKIAAVEEAKKATDEELAKAKEELAKAQEDLQKLGDKDLNFANLRQQKEAAEKRADDALKAVDEKLETVKKEILDGVTQDHKSETLKTLSGDDDELKKKIEFHYGRLGDPATTKEEVTKKLTDAYYLATKPEGADALNTAVIASGGAARPMFKPESQKISPDEEAVLQKLAQAGNMTLEKGKDY